MSSSKGTGIDFDAPLTPEDKPFINVNFDAPITPDSAQRKRQAKSSALRVKIARKDYASDVKENIQNLLLQVVANVEKYNIRENAFAQEYDELLSGQLDSLTASTLLIKYQLFMVGLKNQLSLPTLDTAKFLLDKAKEVRIYLSEDGANDIIIHTLELLLNQGKLQGGQVAELYRALDDVVVTMYDHDDVAQKKDIINDVMAFLYDYGSFLVDKDSLPKKCSEYFEKNVLAMYNKFPGVWEKVAEVFIQQTDSQQKFERRFMMEKLRLQGDQSVKEAVDLLDEEFESLDLNSDEDLGLFDDTLYLLDEVVNDRERKSKSIGERIKALHDRWNEKSTSTNGRRIAVAIMVVGVLALLAGCSLMAALTFSAAATAIPAFAVGHWMLISGSLILGGAMTTAFGVGLFRYSGPSYTANKVGDLEESYAPSMTAVAV